MTPHRELIDAGGLRAAIENACPDSDIEFLEARGAFDGQLAWLRRGERSVGIMPFRNETKFRVTYLLRTMHLRRVFTPDLAVVLGSAATWLGGATAREFATAWPFADFVAIADAFESGDRIECAWQSRLVHDPGRHGEFIPAAMNEPRLRRMYPFTQMGWLSFRPTADEFHVPGPWVERVGDNRFKVCSISADRWHGEPIAECDAETAVRVCVAEMNRLGVPGPDEI
ncbi:DUF6193 family natural product biosynthesis protein [Kutzneria sp. NPDC052558]|uniref:DUF6193 family natural product biosynthesis protein n=1 Tax=Kutzneria sp. NPDC052558 TaxID=3364121 RepID=UPI0037C72D07